MTASGTQATAPRPDRVVVVGAGIVGLSTAWHLLRRGVEVTVVDRTGVAAGASWGNAGYLTPALTLPLTEPAMLRSGVTALVRPDSPLQIRPQADPRLLRFLTAFAAHCTPRGWRRAMGAYALLNALSLEAYDELAADPSFGVAEPTREASPLLAAFLTPADRALLEHELASAREHGAEVDYEIVDGDTARALNPLLGPDVASAARIEGQRFLHPPRYLAALADAVRAAGGTIREGVAVREVIDTGRGVRLLTDSGASVTGEPIVADACVLANGAWLGALAREYGVRQVVQAGRGYSFTVPGAIVPDDPIYLPGQRIACNPLDPGRLRITGMMEFRRPDDPPTARLYNLIARTASTVLTGVRWAERTDEWVGSRPCTADGLPLIGPTRSPRVHVAGGHGMWGVVLGPLTGRWAAAMLTGDEVPAVVSRLDPLR